MDSTSVFAIPVGGVDLWVIGRDGSSQASLGVDPCGATALTADADYVYWHASNAPVPGTLFEHDYGLGRVSKTGGSVEWLAVGIGSAGALAVDESHVYWTVRVAGIGAVRRVPKQGGTVETLASDQDEPVGLVVDATTVYWSVAGSGTIMRATK